MRHSRRRSSSRRRGVVSVEFALIAPVLVGIVLGTTEVSRLYDVQNQLSIAAREGARLASMDRTGMLSEGETTNGKVVQDIQNFLTANGLPGDDVTVFIVDPDDHTTHFDLDDANNDLNLFEIRIEVPYSAIGGWSGEGTTMSAKVVFRNARAVLIQ